MTEVQSHGLLFEDQVIQKITGITKTQLQKKIAGAYTASMDIPVCEYSDHNYSIKVSKQGKSVGCGDILRFYKHCAAEPFTIVIGSWWQINPETKQYREVTEFSISPEHLQILFNKISLQQLTDFVSYVKSIEPGKAAQMAHRKLWKQKRQDIYDASGQGLLKIDAKIDSKDQRRVQCSFDIAELKASGIPYSVYTDRYRDIELPYEVQGKPRSFS